MSAQTRYRFSTPVGMAGGISDLAPYAIDSFMNEEATGTMLFGLGVVSGTKAGTQIKKPVAASTAANFEGITSNNLTTEYDLEGGIHIRNKAAIGVMKYGRIYARVADGVTPAYGDALYLIKSGDEAGYFTNSSSGTIAVKGRFMGPKDATNGIAEVELFNQAQA